MAYQTVILEKEEDIAVLTLNRPETLNAWNEQLELDAWAAVEEVERDKAIRVLIITGAGRGFSSGADVPSLLKAAQGTSSDEGMFIRIVKGEPNLVALCKKLRDMNIPVIAAVNGMTAGGGFGFALACDIRIAAESAKFSMAFIRRGLVPDCGSTFFLPRAVGTGYACELMFSGDVIDAATALRMGIVNRVVPDPELMQTAKELAKRIAKNPPIALRLTKKAIYQGLEEPDVSAHMEREVYCNRTLFDTLDFKEGVTSFLEKREPHFSGR